MNRTKQLFLDCLNGLMLLIVVCGLMAMGGCTIGRYTDAERTLTVIDIHPTGNAVALDASLTGKGKLTLNREQGGTEGIVSEVGDIVSPNPLD